MQLANAPSLGRGAFVPLVLATGDVVVRLATDRGFELPQPARRPATAAVLATRRSPLPDTDAR